MTGIQAQAFHICQLCSKNDRYKMAAQWFALPKLFKASKNEGYQVMRSDDEIIQFKNEQVYAIPSSLSKHY